MPLKEESQEFDVTRYTFSERPQKLKHNAPTKKSNSDLFVSTFAPHESSLAAGAGVSPTSTQGAAIPPPQRLQLLSLLQSPVGRRLELQIPRRTSSSFLQTPSSRERNCYPNPTILHLPPMTRPQSLFRFSRYAKGVGMG